jgi:Conjugal transfer protein TraD
MRTWQIERRKRTRHLIELGGLVVKAGIVDLTGDDRATILGALLWMADKLQSDQGEQARALWAAKGKQAFEVIQQHTTGQIEVLQQFAVDSRR